MRALEPTAAPSEAADEVDLHACYARDWVDQGGIRANMIASSDGAAAASGLSAGLQTPGDNRVFAVLRDLADVVLVGSTTAHVEGYRPVQLSDGQLARRREHGLGPQLPIALVTRSLKVDLSAPLFAGNRPLVVTCSSSDVDARAALAERADLLVCGDDDIDYRLVRRELAERGLLRVLCEGGPRILGRVMSAGEVDELCLTVSPLVAGPGARRIVDGEAWPRGPRQMRLVGVLEEDGALFLRYARPGPVPAS